MIIFDSFPKRVSRDYQNSLNIFTHKFVSLHKWRSLEKGMPNNYSKSVNIMDMHRKIMKFLLCTTMYAGSQLFQCATSQFFVIIIPRDVISAAFDVQMVCHASNSCFAKCRRITPSLISVNEPSSRIPSSANSL